MRSLRRMVLSLIAAALFNDTVSAAPFAYVANIGSDDVTVIDVATHTAIATLAVGNDPDGVAVTPDGTLALVTNFLSDDVSIIDTRAQAVVATQPVGSGPVGIAVSPDGALAYIANKGSNTVSVMRTTPPQVIANIPVGAGPNGIAVSPDGRRVYVTNSFTQDPGTVSVIDASANTVVGTIAVQRSPGRVAFTPDGELAYVTNWKSWSVSLIETATNEVADTIPPAGRPTNVVVNPNNAQAYVISLAGRIQVIDTGTQVTLANIDAGQLPSGDSPQPYGIATTRDGTFAYVANYAGNSVAAVNLTSNEVVAQITAGTRPFAVAVSCVDDGCAAPAITPRPTRTSTPTLGPTRTPTLTRVPTPRPTLTPRAVVISANAESPDLNDDRVVVTIRLDTAGHAVAGTQNDLVFDHTAITLDTAEDCTINPAIADTDPACDTDPTRPCKMLTRHLERCDSGDPLACGEPAPADFSRFRALVFALHTSGPIPDGVLYTCSFRVVDRSRVSTILSVRKLIVADPDGERIGSTAHDATIFLAPTPTLGPTPTLTPRQGVVGAGITLETVRADAGELIEVQATLTTSGSMVAGTQSDFRFDPVHVPVGRRPNGRPDCTVNPAIMKDSTSFAFQPPQCTAENCMAVRAIVFSSQDTAPIPDGAVLYACRIQVAPTAPNGHYPLNVSGVILSDPLGERLCGEPLTTPCTVVDGAVMIQSVDATTAGVRVGQPVAGGGCGIVPGRRSTSAILILAAAPLLWWRRRAQAD